MTRVKRGVTVRKSHKKVLKQCKGFKGRAKNCYRIALRRLEKSWQYAYRDRRVKKRDFRSLWVIRINAAVREHGMIYSRFMNALKLSNISLDRKVLADIAVNNPEIFKTIVDKVKLVGSMV